jgi:hypothetical protein
LRFVKVLRVKPNNCKGEDKLQEAEYEVDDVGAGEARSTAIPKAHPGFADCFRKGVVERAGFSLVGSVQVATRPGLYAMELYLCYAVGFVGAQVTSMASGEVMLLTESCSDNQSL